MFRGTRKQLDAFLGNMTFTSRGGRGDEASTAGGV